MTDRTIEDSPQRRAPRNGIGNKIVQFLCVTNPPAVYFLMIYIILYRIALDGGWVLHVVYFKEELQFSSEKSKFLFHVAKFTSLPIVVLGAWLADRQVGRFCLYIPKDLLWMAVFSSYFYASLLLSVEIQTYVLITGLFLCRLSYIGASSIIAFPGDQYAEDKTADRDNFFFAFYFCLNLGSLLGDILTPKIRTLVPCIEKKESCYTPAFGFVACTSLLSIITLFSGYRFYKFLRPQKQAYDDMLKCVFVAMSRRIVLYFKCFRYCSCEACLHKRSHWIDLADDKYDAEVIYDAKCFIGTARICTVYPMFWALFEQHSTLWTLMAEKLDGRTIFGQITPNEMASFNPIFVMINIVFLACIVYPIGAKCKILRTPFQRIGYGLFFAMLSYVVGGFIFIQVESGLPTYPNKGLTEVSFYNGLPCDVNIEMGVGKNISLPKYTSDKRTDIIARHDLPCFFTIQEEKCSLGNIAGFHFEVDGAGGFAHSVLFTMGRNGTNIVFQQARQNRTREKRSSPKLRFVYLGPNINGRSLYVGSKSDVSCLHLPERLLECSGDDCPEYFNANSMNYMSKLCYNNPLQPDKYQEKACTCDQEIGEYTFLRGGIYDVIIIEDDTGLIRCTIHYHDSLPFILFSYLKLNQDDNEMCTLSTGQKKKKTRFSVVETAAPDSVPILIQLPMFMLLTLGEVMCCATGYAFFYSESPGSRKCLLLGLFYVAQASGNLYVIVIDAIILAFHNSVVIPDYLRPRETLRGSQIFFVYSLVATLNLIYFITLSKRYHYTNPDYRALHLHPS